MDSNYIIGYDLADPNTPDNTLIHFIHEKNNKMYAVKLEVGLKVEVNESVLNTIKSNSYIQNNFSLNIKRLNRYKWSIYFDKK